MFSFFLYHRQPQRIQIQERLQLLIVPNLGDCPKFEPKIQIYNLFYKPSNMGKILAFFINFK
jgi:hypothetical protein